MKPGNFPAKGKKTRQEKRKTRGVDKSDNKKSRLNQNQEPSKVCFLRMPGILEADILQLQQKAKIVEWRFWSVVDHYSLTVTRKQLE